ncbi:hypothetical protein ACFPT7_16750 [Acidicapsa dinghuensis]|uniref:Carboxymuconolactone decarboxylase family protein n=1 Tax=Acidicapsa dinghuensis TaxID=2218256 RepID=A0ABW1EJE0_9BACT|nr:hypothetical protein [Acidicapsa dinghuensis]
MSNITEARKALVARILEGAGQASRADRQAAFHLSSTAGPPAALAEKVAHDPAGISDEDIAVVRASGISEDQVFEIVVCAAIGQASRQYDAALAALETVIGKE